MLPNDGPVAALATVIKPSTRFARKRATHRDVNACCVGSAFAVPAARPQNGGDHQSSQPALLARISLADEISQNIKVPVKVDNDANAAALAEAFVGRGARFIATFS